MATSTAKTEADEPSATATATSSPEAKDSDDDDSATGTSDADDAADDAAGANHGHCVSFAASIVKSLDLSGEQHGAFMSLVAQDKSAVTVKVPDGGTPDAACLTALAKAKAAALAARVSGTAGDHGKDDADHNADNQSGKGEDPKSGGPTNTTPTLSGKGDDRGGHH
jgi:hypothetical protein